MGILGAHAVQACADHLVQCFDGQVSHAAQKGLELREGGFNRREIRRIRGQKQQRATLCFTGLLHTPAFVNREVIHNHDVPRS